MNTQKKIVSLAVAAMMLTGCAAKEAESEPYNTLSTYDLITSLAEDGLVQEGTQVSVTDSGVMVGDGDETGYQYMVLKVDGTMDQGAYEVVKSVDGGYSLASKEKSR